MHSTVLPLIVGWGTLKNPLPSPLLLIVILHLHSSLCRQAPEMKLDVVNTMLVFTVFHRYLAGTDGFVGMCIVPCSNIPRLQGTDAERERAVIFLFFRERSYQIITISSSKSKGIIYPG